MCVFKYHAFIYFLRPPPWSGTVSINFRPEIGTLPVHQDYHYGNCWSFTALVGVTWLSCFDCPFLAFLSALFFLGCPGRAVWFRLSSQGFLSVLSCCDNQHRSLAMAVLNRLFCHSCSVKAVLSWLFCQGILMWTFCHDSKRALFTIARSTVCYCYVEQRL